MLINQLISGDWGAPHCILRVSCTTKKVKHESLLPTHTADLLLGYAAASTRKPTLSPTQLFTGFKGD